MSALQIFNLHAKVMPTPKSKPVAAHDSISYQVEWQAMSPLTANVGTENLSRLPRRKGQQVASWQVLQKENLVAARGSVSIGKGQGKETAEGALLRAGNSAKKHLHQLQVSPVLLCGVSCGHQKGASSRDASGLHVGATGADEQRSSGRPHPADDMWR